MKAEEFRLVEPLSEQAEEAFEALLGNRHAKWTHLGAENGPTWAGL